MADSNFCAVVKLPWIEKCMTMVEWSATWQSIGIAITLIVGGASVWKIWTDINDGRRQKTDTQKLDRTRFFLEQHRRLFDDEDLKDVLQHLDGDDEELADCKFWEKNRKFLVFIEEIQLLINSGLLEEKVCQYMFGYYAECAFNGKNFRKGINFDEEHWILFSSFAKNYENHMPLFTDQNSRELQT